MPNRTGMSSPTASNGKPHSNRPVGERPRPVFRQPAGWHDHPRAGAPAGGPFAGLLLLIPVPRAAKLLGISRAAAYRFASAGDRPTKRLGRRVYVVSAKLREFIETEDEAA